MSNKYTNPDNFKEIIDSLVEAKTHQDLMDIVQKSFPEWLLGTIKQYSSDYPHLQKNWSIVCDKIGVKPTEIVVVDYINSGKDYKLIQAFCELMTTAGYCVRRKEEVIACVKCGDAIPMLELWRKMKKAGLKVPGEWSKKCSSC